MNEDAEEIAICGLDGVLALVEHRLHHLHNESGERDWAAFHAACIDDMPNLPLIHRLNQAREAGTPVVLLSGRSAAVRVQTKQWLHDWQITHDALWLRPEHDRRPALAFKTEVIERHYAGRRIRRVYESAQHLDVARDYTARGIPCTLFGPNQGNGATREQFELKTVRHACEHVTLYPFYGDDDYTWADRIQQLTAGACLLCQAEEAEAERARQAATARLAAQARGLPPLEGSEKQVAWAEGVRLSAFGGIDKLTVWVARVDAEAEREDPDHWRTIKQGIARATAYLEAQTEARWWIDHRHGISNSLDGGRALVNAVAEQEGYF
ncbi:phosphatase domain-containing protein [Acidihalobacter yilgarnensis]|nr:hypothetical protein [Acidihalobacter yilgarnensis]